MPFEIASELIENDDVRINTDGNNNFVLENKRTGDTIQLNDGGELAVDSVDAQSVSTVEADIGNRWGTAAPQVGARLASTEDLDLYVSPTGDNSNDGLTQSSPVADPYHAFAKIPKLIYHNVRVHLDYGTYTQGSQPLQLQNHLVTARNNNGLRILGHDSRNAFYDSANSVQDVTFDGNWFVSACRGSEESPEISGVTIDGRLQAYDSSMLATDCRFETGSGAHDQMIGGHGGKLKVSGCDFAGTGAEVAVYAQDMARIILLNCSGSSLGAAARVHQSIVNFASDAGLSNFGIASNVAGLVLGGGDSWDQSPSGGATFKDNVTVESEGGVSVIKVDSPDNAFGIDFLRNGVNQFRFNYVDTSNRVDFRDGGDVRMSLNLTTGDLSIEGTLTEGASL